MWPCLVCENENSGSEVCLVALLHSAVSALTALAISTAQWYLSDTLWGNKEKKFPHSSYLNEYCTKICTP